MFGSRSDLALTLRTHGKSGRPRINAARRRSWLGVAQYSNHEILYDLQLGFQQVKANYNIPNARAGRVTIYKTLNTGQIVYDYAVQISPTLCQEYLFTPLTQGFQLGFRVNCLMSLGLRGGSSAGRLGRT